MHTCAHNPLPGTDLFDPSDDAPQWAGVDLATGPDQTAGLYIVTGTLARNAEVRTKPIGHEGNPAPVLCMDIVHVGPTAHTVHAEQVYPEPQRKQAETMAAQLRKGMRVTVHCPMAQARIALPAVTHIQIQPAAKA